MPGERHPGTKTSLGGGVIRDLMGAKTERLILAFSFGGVSLRAVHQARVCISRVVSYRKQYRIVTTTTATADAQRGLMQCPERGTLRNSYTSSGGGLIRDLMGAKTERLILAFSFGGISLRALHQARVCISSCLL